jgi:hypothetical protein
VQNSNYRAGSGVGDRCQQIKSFHAPGSLSIVGVKDIDFLGRPEAETP